MLADFFQPFQTQTVTTSVDALGNPVQAFSDGGVFMAGIAPKTQQERAMADQNGLYLHDSLVFPIDVALHQNDRVKCVSTGQMYRLCGEPITTPAPAFIQYAVADIEAVIV